MYIYMYNIDFDWYKTFYESPVYMETKFLYIDCYILAPLFRTGL